MGDKRALRLPGRLDLTLGGRALGRWALGGWALGGWAVVVDTWLAAFAALVWTVGALAAVGAIAVALHRAVDVALDLRHQVLQLDEVVGLAAQLVGDHRRLGADGRHD